MATKRRWQKGVAGSVFFHLLLFLLIAFLFAVDSTPLAARDEFVEIDYFSGTGGGGGGGGGGPEIETRSIFEEVATGQNSDNSLHEQKEQSYDREAITDKSLRSEESGQTSSPQSEKRAVYPGSDKLPNTGSGGGFGTGKGTGVGSGTGSGSGSGSGGGHGSGSGSGIGSGSGAGTGGSASQVATTPPRVLFAGQLRYPESARTANIEGTVKVKVFIDENGRVVDAQIAVSSGDSALDQEALRYIRLHRFQAARNGQGVPIKCYVNKDVAFQLIN